MTKVLLLGATSEVAIALAEQLAAQSCEIILAARRVNRLQPLKADLEVKHQTKITLAEFDAEQPDTHVAFYNSLESVDTAICVFGYLGNHSLALAQWSESLRIINANFTGAVSILNLIAADFEKKKNGVMVGISSVAGERGRQSNYLYGSAKAAFTTYLAGLRNRLYPAGVHVVTVKPGFIQTKMLQGLATPRLLTAQPQQVASKVIKAIQTRKNVIYVLPIWRLIMCIIRSIPETIFKRLKL